MAITNTEHLSDRVRVHHWCKRPWGEADDYAVVELLYESLHSLPAPPPLDHGYHGCRRDTWEEFVYLPTQDVTVSFHFARWEETDDCRMEALIEGPYWGKLAATATAAKPTAVAR
jgi:hypothetical protein